MQGEAMTIPKTSDDYERDIAELADQEHIAFLTGDVEKMELIRNARRYLALRESRNFSAASGFANPWGLRMTAAPLKQSEREQLDEAADMLLERGK